MEDTSPSPRAFVPSRLPWLVAIIAFGIYVLTLNPWISSNSLETTVQLGGWEGSQLQTRPLLWLVSLPVRLSAGAKLPFAANLLAALSAAGVLGLIARCVALLPHDRTREQRVRGHSDNTMLHTPFAWAPPVFAVGLVGLQLTFWEQATAQTGEMLDLLVFVYCIRCLLEYRVDLRESWLWRFAFSYGVGIAGNWAMLGFLPLAAIALCWIRGLAVFNANFLLRFAGWGAAGLLTYLLMPVVGRIQSGGEFGIWPLLHNNLAIQKAYLFGLPRGRFLLLSLVDLAPLVLLGIRWTGTKGSSLERIVSAGAVIVLQFFWLGTAIYMGFDTAFSQRRLVHLDPQFGGIPLLTFHVTGALAAAYFLGYFLLIGGQAPGKVWDRSSPGLRALAKAAFGLMAVLAIGVPAALFTRNWPVIRAHNGPALDRFARAMAEPLPNRPGVVIIDDPFLHALLLAHLRREPGTTPHLLLNTQLAPQIWYRRQIARENGAQWPELAGFAAARQGVADLFIRLVSRAATNQLAFYLNPTANFILERFHPRPTGSVFRLAPYAPGAVAPPPLDASESAAVSAYWDKLKPELDAVSSAAALGAENARGAAKLWARTIDTDGVLLQEAGQLEAAARLFDLARNLDRENVAAEVNSRVNAALRAGRPIPAEARKPLAGQSVGRVFTEQGPVDEPQFLFASAQAMERAAEPLARAAAVRFLRARQLDPTFTLAALGYIDACLSANEPAMALAAAADLRAKEQLKPDEQAKLIRLEATALFRQSKPDEAEKLLVRAREQLPAAPDPLDLLSQLYIEVGRYDDAVQILDQWQRLQPEEPAVANRRVIIFMSRQQFDQALPILEKLVRQDPENDFARGNRAICLLQTGKLHDARRDYEKLVAKYPDRHIFQYGLGEIADQQKETSTALKHFERYLATAPRDTVEYTNVLARVTQLKSGK